MMEVAQRTDADKKGGHLARDAQSGELLLRESAQCPKEDEDAFQDTAKYKSVRHASGEPSRRAPRDTRTALARLVRPIG